MARPRLAEPAVDWKLNIPGSLAGRVELLLFNRALGKPRYGARNRIVVALLDAWLREQTARLAGDPSPNAFSEVPNLEDILRL